MRESNERPPRKPFINPLLMFAYPDVLVLLIFTGTYYAVMYGVTASLSVIFQKAYPYLTQTDLGLCFLGIGGGMLFGTWFSGRVSDAYYRKIRDGIIRQAQSHSEKDVDPKAIEQDPSFPIEKARLQLLPCVMFVYIACVMGYGWSLQSKVSIAVPLICQIISKFGLSVLHCTAWVSQRFIVGLTCIIIFNATQTLLVDLFPNQGSSITACVGPPFNLPTTCNFDRILLTCRTTLSGVLWALAWCPSLTPCLTHLARDGRTLCSAASAY